MSIRRATVEDLRAIGEACATGFDKDELFGDFMHPHRHEYWEDFIHFFEKRVGKRLLDAKHVVLVAFDEHSGRVAGMGDWVRGGKGGDQRAGNVEFQVDEKERTKIETYLASLPEANRACNPSKMTALSESIPLTAHFWTGPREEHWDLSLLAVHSDFEGRGYGKKLALWGVEQARQDGVAASVVSAYQKDGFYGKLGWKKVGMANVGSLEKMEGGTIMFIDV